MMFYYQDLSPWTRFGDKAAQQLKAIGWIDQSHAATATASACSYCVPGY